MLLVSGFLLLIDVTLLLMSDLISILVTLALLHLGMVFLFPGVVSRRRSPIG